MFTDFSQLPVTIYLSIRKELQNMTTYQMVADLTHADLALVKKCSRAILGNKHRATTAEIHNIIKMIETEQEKEGYNNNGTHNITAR